VSDHNKPCSDVETEILAALRANGGSYSNAYQMIVRDLGRAWAHGYRCLDNLERQGRIEIIRHAQGKPTEIRLVNR
jgi:uncharacterized membrane protein